MAQADPNIGPRKPASSEDETLDQRLDALLGELEDAVDDLEDDSLHESVSAARTLEEAIDAAGPAGDEDGAPLLDEVEAPGSSDEDADDTALLDAQGIDDIEVEAVAAEAVAEQESEPAQVAVDEDDARYESIEQLDEALAGAAEEELESDDPAIEPGPAQRVSDETGEGAEEAATLETADSIVEGVVEEMGAPVGSADVEAPDGAPGSAEDAGETEADEPGASGEAEAPAGEAEAPDGARGGERKGAERPRRARSREVVVRAATIVSQPLRLVPPSARVYVGYFGIISIFNGVFIWLALLLRG